MENGKLFIKNILITIFMIMSVNCAFANSFIMIAPSNITKVECGNKDVVGLHIISTLMNEKKSVIVTSGSEGETSFALYMKHKKCDYKATVHNGELNIKGNSAIKILSIDLPPEFESTEVSK